MYTGACAVRVRRVVWKSKVTAAFSRWHEMYIQVIYKNLCSENEQKPSFYCTTNPLRHLRPRCVGALAELWRQANEPIFSNNQRLERGKAAYVGKNVRDAVGVQQQAAQTLNSKRQEDHN